MTTVVENEKLGVAPSTKAFDSQTATVDSVAESKGSLEKAEKNSNASPSDATEEDDSDIEYPTGVRLAIIITALIMVVFIVALDNTIIATAIPTITTVFNSLNDVGWYGSAYLLTMTSLQPTFGKLYTNFDIKITYLSALLIFEVGSVLCAAATSSVMLIVGRAVAGLGASALFVGALNIITYTVPLRKRPTYIAAVSSMFGIASVVGPLLGGVFTDKASWRWCFWINLPFGGFTAVVLLFFFKSPHRKANEASLKERILQIDILGAILLVGGITSLLLALQWGGTEYPWSDSKIIGLFVGFALMLVLFLVVQWKRGDNATIPPRIIKQRTVLSGALFSTFWSMAFFIHAFYLPFYFQAIKGTSAVQSGIRLIPYLTSTSVASVIVGGLITVFGFYAPFFWFGSALFTVACGLFITLDVDSSSAQWLGYQFAAGFGAGAAVQIPFLSTQVALPTVDIPMGNSIVMFAQSFGGAISISIGQNIFSNQLVKQVAKNVPQLDGQAILHAPATSLRTFIPAELLDGVLKSYARALQITFIPAIAFAAAGFFSSLLIERLSVKGKKVVHSGGA